MLKRKKSALLKIAWKKWQWRDFTTVEAFAFEKPESRKLVYWRRGAEWFAFFFLKKRGICEQIIWKDTSIRGKYIQSLHMLWNSMNVNSQKTFQFFFNLEIISHSWKIALLTYRKQSGQDFKWDAILKPDFAFTWKQRKTTLAFRMIVFIHR